MVQSNTTAFNRATKLTIQKENRKMNNQTQCCYINTKK